MQRKEMYIERGGVNVGKCRTRLLDTSILLSDDAMLHKNSESEFSFLLFFFLSVRPLVLSGNADSSQAALICEHIVQTRTE